MTDKSSNSDIEIIINPDKSNKRTTSTDDSSSTDISSSNNSSSSYKSMSSSIDTNITGIKNCNDNNFYTNDCNKFILKKELLERNYLSKHEDENSFLYPNLNDKLFNIKIAQKKEFNDTQYDGPDFSKSIKEQSEFLANAPYELQPHQAFVKNFMSFQTPYSSLLLYHGLGSGKTCSAIGVTEEMRDYMKQIGLNKRIIIVASENVQDNFKLQLFDDRKLKEVNGIWSIKGCIGNKLLKEINPMNMPMTKEKIVSQIKNLINSYYIFLGYVQFANYIIKTMNYEEMIEEEKKEKGKKEKIKDVEIELTQKVINRLRNEFNDRLIVIDEVHNIRKSDDNENKKVAINLEILVKSVLNMRLLFLSATPMYNNYKEIIWLLNIMNMNDKRGKINVKDVFDKKGNFKKNGEELLIRKATGYISFVRGENPYTFPYRVYPNSFAPNQTFPNVKYPSYQMNLKKIGHEDKKRILHLYLNTIGNCDKCGKCQYCCYKYIIYNLRQQKMTVSTKYGVTREMPSFENMESFGYTLLQIPLESLIISYPIDGLKKYINKDEHYSEEISPSFSDSTNVDEPIEPNDKIMSDETIDESIAESVVLIQPKHEKPKDNKTPPKHKKCIDNKELNPKTNRCVMPCKDGFTRNENFKCIKNKNIIKTPPPSPPSPSSSEEIIIQPVQTNDESSSQYDITIKPTKKLDESIEDTSSPYDIIINPTKKSNDTSSQYNTIIKPTKKLDESIEDSSSSYDIIINPKKKSKDSWSSPDDIVVFKPKIKTLDQSSKIKKGGETNSTSDSESDSKSEDEENQFIIDPKQLTGKNGLERMMNYVDSKSPPLKGEFEYKKNTLDKYGNIFSRKEIGKYSSKINSILNSIYNSDTDTVSEGIILIYSQYIDSGLIPVALALEEMGFTRYGDTSVKSLFKNKPSDVIDVRTMQPPKNKKDFKPARYSMITGDPRLSPNNDFEVKGLTTDDNINGEKCKVILISRAGSEGIDFKFIRQVHILDPWYNMNRIEQIIGRAVRNFSHALLPFEKRNVQIFLHGTMLENNKEESADLYVYRVAEFKAIQIGKVARVLKETSVDCIINHDQTKFTQEYMKLSLKEEIQQKLSTGIVLDKFKVGDAPFSPTCDYMATCDYSCRPNADANKLELNEDTYDEKFIVMNSDKIVQKIKLLFKESFFYKKDLLMKLVRTPKEYPYVQIYSALTQLIEDENDFIVDKYGRNGKLVNIGEYYLFQPIELLNKNISIYDRSVPLDYKHNFIDFQLKQNIVKPVIDKRNLTLEEENIQGQNYIEKLKTNYDLALEYMEKTKVDRGDDNWYKHCGIVMKKLKKEYSNLTENSLKYYLVSHIIEMLMYEDKLDLMNYIYSLKSIPQSSFERILKDYFENNSIHTSKTNVYVTYNKNKNIILTLGDKNKWEPTSSKAENKEIASFKEVIEFLKPSKYNDIVGFIGYEKGNKDVAFKTKVMTAKRDTGARCDQAGKKNNLKKINTIIGEEKYTSENTKMVKDARGKLIKDAISNVEICVLIEFTLRYFNEIKKDDKTWFLTPEMAIYHKLYTVFV